MAKWKDTFKKLAHKAESRFDELQDRLTYRLGLFDKVHAVIYHGYANEHEAHIHGRVLEDRNIKPASEGASKWSNLLDTYKRLGSKEVPNALLEIEFAGIKQEVRADEEGYFQVKAILNSPLPAQIQTHTVTAKLLDFPAGALVDASGDTGNVFCPSPQAHFGIISDIDDTIMQTGATNLLKMAWATFTKNARTRIAFKGVSQFYQALQEGISQQQNPFFYVSSSPWNLYDLLTDFISMNEIPMGPLFLRDYGIDENKFLTGTHGQHKRASIERLLKLYPTLPFILIGDSGQEDAFIYYQIAQDYPGRILAIYIRDAQVSAQQERVMATVHKANAEGIDMLLVHDSLIAARHAATKGFIDSKYLSAIEEEIIEEAEKDEMVDQLFIGKNDL